jgi:hypothetical protein
MPSWARRRGSTADLGGVGRYRGGVAGTSVLAAAVPLAVLVVIIASLVTRTRRGDFGSTPEGRQRAPWLLPVLGGAGAWVVLYLLFGR